MPARLARIVGRTRATAGTTWCTCVGASVLRHFDTNRTGRLKTQASVARSGTSTPSPLRSRSRGDLRRTKPSFSNFSRSSFNMSIQYVKQKSQMRLPRGLRSDTESKTESELSSCESTEVGCLIGLASEVVSSCKQSCCMRYLAHRVRPTRIHSVGRGGTGQRMIAFPL